MPSPTLPVVLNYEDNRMPLVVPALILSGAPGLSYNAATMPALQVGTNGAVDISTSLSVKGTSFLSAAPTPGVSQASAPLVLGANKNTDVLVLPVSGLAIGAGAGTAVNATAAELNVLNGATAGTIVAGKAVVAGPLGQVQGFGSDTAVFTTTGALTAAQSGCTVILNASASFVLSLPAANALGAGVSIMYRLFLQVATGSGVGHIVRPVGSDTMLANFVTTPAAAKGAVNTQATSHLGDGLMVFSDGVSKWYASASGGIWTREA